MQHINTVRGVLPVDELGVTLMHEHVINGADGTLLDWRVRVDRADLRSRAVEQLRAARSAGISTIVDATTIDMYRDASFLCDVSEESGLNIVCCTGLYAASDGLPAYFRRMSRDDLVGLYVAEIQAGIGDTGVRAGAIKVATSPEAIAPVEIKVLEAAGEAQRLTGVPIVTHTSGSGGLEQAEILIAAGASPNKIVIGHVDHKASSFAYLERILRTGVYLGLDRVGRDVFLRDGFRAGLIAGLLDEGYMNRLCLSMDSCAAPVGPEHPLARDAPPAFVHIMSTFANRLERFGIDNQLFLSILTANPLRLFSAEV